MHTTGVISLPKGTNPFLNIMRFGRGIIPAPRKPIILPLPPDHGCKFPKNPFEDINPGNPSSWYNGVSKLISGLLRTMNCLEAKTTRGILGDPSYNPQEDIHNRFKVNALLGRMYTLLQWINQMTKQNQEALKDTFDLAKPAR